MEKQSHSISMPPGNRVEHCGFLFWGCGDKKLNNLFW
eukprot:UN04737